MQSLLCNYYSDFDFTAQWITCPGADTPNCCLDFFSSFDYCKAAPPAILYIAAESYYRLYVNGVFIGQGPVRGTWSVNYFDAYDLTTVLQDGHNDIGVLIQSMNDKRNFNTHPAGCALLAEIPGVLSTGTHWKARFTPGWIPTTASFAIQQGFRCEYDLRQEQRSWLRGENTSSWEHAVTFCNDEIAVKQLRPRGVPPLRETRVMVKLLTAAEVKVEPVAPEEDIADVLNRETWSATTRISQNGDNQYQIKASADGAALIFDLGTSCNGFFEADIVAGAGTRLDITYGEELWHGRVRAAFRKKARNDFFTDTYYLKEGHNFISNYFLAHGGSLVQLVFRNMTAPVTTIEPLFRDRRYPYQPAAKFSCSDSRLNRIWELCRETISVCTTDTFEDCPWREHAFWVNDLIVENMTSLLLFGSSDIHRHSLELVFSQQYEDGWCPGVVPVKYAPEKPVIILPATNFFLFIILADYYWESDDRKTVRHFLPNLEKILAAAEKERDEDGLIGPPEYSWNFFDWGYELQNITFRDSRESMLNSLYIIAMRLYCALCRAVELPCNEELYAERIARISRGLAKRIAPDTGLIADPAWKMDYKTGNRERCSVSSELSLAFALFSRVWPEEKQKHFIEAILSGKLLSPDLYLSDIVFQQLVEYGKAGEVLRRIRKYWGLFVDMGMKTIPEIGIPFIGRSGMWDNTSFCHGFATCPVRFFRRTLLGIRPLEPGYKVFEFAPVPLDLDCASGEIHTPHGMITVSWKNKGEGQLEAELQIPAGCTVRLKDGRQSQQRHCKIEMTIEK